MRMRQSSSNRLGWLLKHPNGTCLPLPTSDGVKLFQLPAVNFLMLSGKFPVWNSLQLESQLDDVFSLSFGLRANGRNCPRMTEFSRIVTLLGY